MKNNSFHVLQHGLKEIHFYVEININNHTFLDVLHNILDNLPSSNQIIHLAAPQMLAFVVVIHINYLIYLQGK
jgi:hypothetical protein